MKKVVSFLLLAVFMIVTLSGCGNGAAQKKSWSGEPQEVTTIILVRHGQTDYNVEGRLQGHLDSPLNETGLAQADKLAEYLKDVPIDVCFSSPLSRANTTAKKVAALHDLPVSVDDRLIEIDHGDWTNHLKSALKKDYPEEYNKYTQTPRPYTGPNAESLSDMGKRGAEALQEIACKNPGKTVLVAAHSDFNKATVCEILGLEYEHFNELQQDNTSISILRYDGNWKLCVWNSIPHLGCLTEGIALSD